MAEGRIIARTATFALFRSPVTMVDPGPGGKHSKANLHYAFCVNRTTGTTRCGRLDHETRVGASTGAGHHGQARRGCCLHVRARCAGKTDSGNRPVFLVVCHAGPPAGSKAARAARTRNTDRRDEPPPGRERSRTNSNGCFERHFPRSPTPISPATRRPFPPPTNPCAERRSHPRIRQPRLVGPQLITVARASRARIMSGLSAVLAPGKFDMDAATIALRHFGSVDQRHSSHKAAPYL